MKESYEEHTNQGSGLSAADLEIIEPDHHAYQNEANPERVEHEIRAIREQKRALYDKIDKSNEQLQEAKAFEYQTTRKQFELETSKEQITEDARRLVQMLDLISKEYDIIKKQAGDDKESISYLETLEQERDSIEQQLDRELYPIGQDIKSVLKPFRESRNANLALASMNVTRSKNGKWFHFHGYSPDQKPDYEKTDFEKVADQSTVITLPQSDYLDRVEKGSSYYAQNLNSDLSRARVVPIKSGKKWFLRAVGEPQYELESEKED